MQYVDLITLNLYGQPTFVCLFFGMWFTYLKYPGIICDMSLMCFTNAESEEKLNVPELFHTKSVNLWMLDAVVTYIGTT